MLLLLFNRSGDSGIPGIPGPYYIDAAQAYVPGAVAADIYTPGIATGQCYAPGIAEGEGCPE